MMLEAVFMERDRWRIKKEPCAILKIFLEEIDKAKAWGSEKKINIHYDGLKAPLVIYADSSRIKNLVGYLLLQSIKSSQEKGKIDFDVALGADEITVRILDESQAPEQAELEGMFNKPNGLPNEPSGQNGASIDGFGFYICRKIVEAHKGRIWVKSMHPEKGRELGFQMPIDSVPATQAVS